MTTEAVREATRTLAVIGMMVIGDIRGNKSMGEEL